MAATIFLAEYLVVNSVPLGIRACFTESLAPLFEDPPPIGDNVHLPATTGRRGYGKDQDELHVTLPLIVNGAYKFADDTLQSNPRQGLITNRKYLRDNLGTSALDAGNGTVTVVWHQPDGSTTVTVAAQVLGLFGWVKIAPAVARTTLDLIVPAGVFA